MASAASPAGGKGLSAALLLLAACGRVGFEPAVRDADGSAHDASTAGDSSSGGGRVAPTMRQSGITSMANAMAVSTMVTLAPDQAGRAWAFAAVHVGSTCGDLSTPTVASVTYSGAPMTKVGAVIGTPCSPALTRTELYRYDAPASGAGTITATLSGTARTFHLNGFVVEDVESVGAQVPRSDNTMSGTVDVPTEPAELAIVIVGTGDPILIAGSEQKVLHNGSGAFTLDNSAVYSVAATGATTSIMFTQGLADEWQALGVAIRGPLAP